MNILCGNGVKSCFSILTFSFGCFAVFPDNALEKSSSAECLSALSDSSVSDCLRTSLPSPGDVGHSVSSSNSLSNDFMPLLCILLKNTKSFVSAVER